MMIILGESPHPDLGKELNQTSFAHSRVRADILLGRLKPGERLKVADLASILTVSPGAVREALSRLLPEQLVVWRDQKGYAVAPLSIEDLHDLTEMRCEIEAIALRRAVSCGDASWEAEILASAHRLRRTPKISTIDHSLEPGWVNRHAAFHAALVGACDNRRLLDLHAQLYQQSERYRNLSININGGRDGDAEHQSLVDAALDRDSARLVELAISHFRKTTAMIVDVTRSSSSHLT